MNGVGWQSSFSNISYSASRSARAMVSPEEERLLTSAQKRKLEEQFLTPAQKKEAEQEENKRMGIRKKYDPHDPTCECETCKRRKYQDGSDEMVSFKTAQHMSPAQAATRVRAHEQEHVANAYSKAEQNNGKVLRASVRIHTAICPECGRTYVSGGVTDTQIKYYNEDNPYQKALKSQDHEKYAGRNINYYAG